MWRMKLCLLVMAVLSYSLAAAAEMESKDANSQVTSLLQMAAGFGHPPHLTRSWTGGDPCLGWLGVLCDNNHAVALINLALYDLSRTISPAVSKLVGLKRLVLSNNHLTGGIPSGLAALPNLEVLDVRNNSLTSQVPKFRPSVHLLLDGNHFGG
ncbi:hypothetical protein QOZ80_6BG0479230 [Eleusine coracana subsp. coracana]|nr:hypothetical protein QOZ80_6BG0479230 [Eleusine coracana subsp. coracana]